MPENAELLRNNMVFAAANDLCRRCGEPVVEGHGNIFRDVFGFDILCRDCVIVTAIENGINPDLYLENLDNEQPQAIWNVLQPVVKEKKPKFEEGKIIKSKRTFGLEFEINLGREGQRALRDNIKREFNLVHDGSVNAGIEIVSPILNGKDGEDKINNLCEVMKKVKAGADDSCGLHVHVDASDFFDDEPSTLFTLERYLESLAAERSGLKDYKLFILDQNILKDLKDYSYGLYESIYETGRLDSFGIDEFLGYLSKQVTTFPVVYTGDGDLADKSVTYCVSNGSRGARVKFSELIKTDEDIKKYKGEPQAVALGYQNFILIDKQFSKGLLLVAVKNNHPKASEERLKRIKRVASFYVAFDDVLAAMLPCDRRDNDFAIRTSTRLSIRDVYQCKTVLDFFNSWTKTKDLRGFRFSLGEPRHESRYYGINFRALLKHGTIEIRYHAGTTDAEKALYWTALHQKIVDIASNLMDPRFNLERLEKADMVIDIDRKSDLFFSKLELPKETEDYLRKRIKEYATEDKHFVDSLIADDKQK